MRTRNEGGDRRSSIGAGTLVRFAGRLHRLHPGYREVRIYSYFDNEVPMLRRRFETRLSGYRAIGLVPEPGHFGRVRVPIRPAVYQPHVRVHPPENRIQLTFSSYRRINATVGALVGSAPYEERPMRALATQRIAERQRLTRRGWLSCACVALESPSVSDYFDTVAGTGMGMSNPWSHTLRQI